MFAKHKILSKMANYIKINKIIIWQFAEQNTDSDGERERERVGKLNLDWF